MIINVSFYNFQARSISEKSIEIDRVKICRNSIHTDFWNATVQYLIDKLLYETSYFGD